MKKTSFRIAGVIVATAWVLINFHEVSGQPTQHDPPPATNALIVFVGGDRTIGYGIFKRDLSDPSAKDTQLTHLSYSKTSAAGKPHEEKIPTIGREAAPRWSPGGHKIAFVGGGPIRWDRAKDELNPLYNRATDNFDHVHDIWVMDEDGHEIKPLVQVGQFGGITGFRWSPDGNKIAFVGQLPGRKYGLGAVDVNTRKIEVLHDYGSIEATKGLAEDICWSPDGKAVVWCDRRKVSIFNVGGKVTDITRGDEFVSHPYWWPDGKITFCRGGVWAEQSRNFWIMDPDGNNQARITEGRNIVELPSGKGDKKTSAYAYPFWLSGDGRTIAFASTLPNAKPRRRELGALCIRKIGDPGPGEILTLDLTAYDVCLEPSKHPTTQPHPPDEP